MEKITAKEISEKIFYLPAANGKTPSSIIKGEEMIENYAALKSQSDKRELVEMMKRVSKVIDNQRSEDVPFDIYQVWHQMNELIQKHQL